MKFHTDVIIVVGIGLGVVAIAWYAKYKAGQVAENVIDGAGALWDKTTEAAAQTAHYINPWADNNAYGDVYTYTLWNLGAHPTNDQIKAAPMGAGVALDLYQSITGSKGNQIDDFNNWWDGLWK